MNLDRGLIKAQAKELIKGKVMKLFITVLVVELCVSIVPGIINGINFAIQPSYNIFDSYGDYFDSFDEQFNRYYDYDDEDYYNQYEDDFENFGTDNNSGKGDFYNFGTSFIPTSAKTVIDTEPVKAISISPVLSSSLSFIGYAAEILLMPLTVTLLYYFVLFIRGKEFNDADGIKFIFKEAFSNGYSNKIGVTLLRSILIFLLAMLFFIPGIIFSYSSYFAPQIMCDNPQLTPMQAIKISKKMIKGNRTELFILDLSFIPWSLLCIFIFPLIYVIPYVETTRALYYENFRIRAMQQGRITEDDFLTDLQKMQKYSSQSAGTYQAQANQYTGSAQANPNAYQYTNTGYYTPPQNNAAVNTNGTVPQNEPVHIDPQPTVEPDAQAEPPKPSEKYTPVTPPSEEYNKTETTAE